ncbi:DUF1254 domain-containing protein [Gilvimarinus sp. SDUM040013]|uniref:DUF1254 domain-containing protein n=1 Tax=Gilvimarinus gilvus TaxID=3058038 RepID=A0ABU4S2W0_9GAMM|nr:DUF1254 domain-containing protein [Gilvimarinus sp. SDUM040013]MDO3387547.1 DUF1254 domain-containing protein [Gilvimarinus sp. SDUM040013]MDX6850188.1 DUF1254 domain-containing protein [Gilvimarinus sp. SDUM040013]
MKSPLQGVLVGSVLIAWFAQAQADRYESLANIPLDHNRAGEQTAQVLKEELIFQRASQTYLWALPLLNTMGMRDGFAESYSPTYNTMAIWTKRLDARTQVTTPNSDLIYGISFVNLAETGPLVFEAPPKLQGILLDFWQRPIPHDGGEYFGDIGLPGPDGGKGGKFLILPPGYKGDVPSGHYVYRSGTNNVFIFLRSFYQSLDNISPAVDVLKQSKLYPLGKKSNAKGMVFEDASQSGHNMLPRTGFDAFKQLKYLVDTEGSNLAGPDWLGMLAGLGIVEGQPFSPNKRTKELLAQAAETAYKTSRMLGMQEVLNGEELYVYKDRQWVNPINNIGARWPDSKLDLSFSSRSGGYTDLDARAWFFTDYYSISPGMVSMTPGKGAYYMIAFKDEDQDHLNGEHSYKLRLPKDIPAKLFWSVTLYEAASASGLDNGQPFPSLGKLDNPVKNADGSTTLYIGPKAPKGKEKNWLATVPGKGFFSILRLYLPTETAIDGSWKPGDIEKLN